MPSEWIFGTLENATPKRRTASDDLDGRVFSRYHQELAWCARMKRDPRFRDEFVRTAETAEGRLVAQLYITDRMVRIESVVLRMGGIAAVGSEPAFRKRGLASMLMKDAIAYMARSGFDISILFSIPADFYNRFGYMTVFPEYASTISGLSRLHGLRKIKTPLRIRSLTPGDIERIAPLYERTYHDTTGSCIRNTVHWQWLHLHPDFRGVIVMDGDHACAYALDRIDGNRLVVHEVGAEPSPRAHDALLKAIARRALSAGVTEIRLELPTDLPFARLCILEHEAVQTVTVPRSRGGMAKIIHLTSTMQKLEGVLSHRLQHSEYRSLRRNLVLATDIGAVRLTIDRGKVTTTGLSEDYADNPDVALPQSALLGLIFGLFYPLHVWEVWGRPIPADMLSLLTVLFPKRFPQMPRVDHF